MKKSDAYPDRSSYLSKEDVMSAPKVGTIAGVSHKVFEDDDGEKRKPVVSFKEEELKPMVYNVTNWDNTELLYGDDSDMWIGKKIEIYFDPTVMNKGKRVGGVRVRKPAETQKDSAPAELWNWAQCVKECEKAGIPVEALKQYYAETLKRTNYKASTDTAIVKKFIADTLDGKEEPIK